VTRRVTDGELTLQHAGHHDFKVIELMVIELRERRNADPRPDVFEHGYWRSCSGCHETDEGYETGPYSEALRCHLGSGCHECGGIGAVWEQVDDDELAALIAGGS